MNLSIIPEIKKSMEHILEYILYLFRYIYIYLFYIYRVRVIHSLRKYFFKCNTLLNNSLTQKFCQKMRFKKLSFYKITNNVINIITVMFLLQTLDFDRDGLTKLKKAIKAIHNSGNGKSNFHYQCLCNCFFDC